MYGQLILKKGENDSIRGKKSFLQILLEKLSFQMQNNEVEFSL